MMKYKLYLFIFWIVGISSCHNDGLFDCMEGAGKVIEKEIFLDSFNNLKLLQEVDVEIVAGERHVAILKGGENWVNQVSLDVKDNWLEINNTNYCNLAKKKGNLKIELVLPNLDSIWTYDYSNISTKGDLPSDSLWIKSMGSGDLDLQVKTSYIHVRCEFVSKISLKGTTDYIFVHFTQHGIFQGQSLSAEKVHFIHDGSHDLSFFAKQWINGSINSTGNVLLYNKPLSVQIGKNDIGKLFEVYE